MRSIVLPVSIEGTPEEQRDALLNSLLLSPVPELKQLGQFMTKELKELRRLRVYRNDPSGRWNSGSA